MAFRKDITFFYSNPVERETAVPIAAEAERRGYTTHMTDEPFRKAEIGLYCQHDCFPRHSRLALVMLHDMGQGQLHWPNMWRFEPWCDFEAGILPGEVWAQRWRDSSEHSYAHPRRGVFTLGWPKSDDIFNGAAGGLSATAMQLREQLNLQHEVSILYAPAWENDNKQDEFVQALMDLPVNLLLKQFPWTDQWPEQVRNVAMVNAMHRDLAPNVHVLDPNISIMNAIELADIMVSEESSCLIEALLKGRPAISVSDWMVPDMQPPRLPLAPFDFLIRTPKQQLAEVVAEMLTDLPAHQDVARRHRDRNFSKLGEGAASIMDLVDALASGADSPFEPLTAETELRSVPLADRSRRQLRRAVYILKHKLGIRQPLKHLLHGLLRRS
jgi:hypothetical protein